MRGFVELLFVHEPLVQLKGELDILRLAQDHLAAASVGAHADGAYLVGRWHAPFKASGVELHHKEQAGQQRPEDAEAQPGPAHFEDTEALAHEHLRRGPANEAAQQHERR